MLNATDFVRLSKNPPPPLFLKMGEIPIKIYTLTLFTLVYSRKKNKHGAGGGRWGGWGGVQDMDFPGGCGISRGDQEKSIWNFQGSWFLILGFPRDVTQFFTISGGGALICLEFPGVK